MWWSSRPPEQPHRNWQRQNLDIVIQVAVGDIENLVGTIMVRGATLKIRVDGRIPRCYKCGLKGHIRVDCPSPYVKAKDRKENENVAGIPLSLEVEEK